MRLYYTFPTLFTRVSKRESETEPCCEGTFRKSSAKEEWDRFYDREFMWGVLIKTCTCEMSARITTKNHWLYFVRHDLIVTSLNELSTCSRVQMWSESKIELLVILSPYHIHKTSAKFARKRQQKVRIERREQVCRPGEHVVEHRPVIAEEPQRVHAAHCDVDRREDKAHKCQSLLSFPFSRFSFVLISDGTFVYPYDKRMCYFDTLIEKS